MLSKFFGNTRKPEGFGGKLMVAMMNGGHAGMARWGLAHISLGADAWVLDAGCGGGANLAALLRLCPAGTVAGLDHSPVSVEAALKKNAAGVQVGRCRVVQGDVLALPFGDSSFDAVTAFETVYFWPDIENAFREVRRVLRPGGIFFICNEDDGEKASGQKWAQIIDGMTVYDSRRLTTLLESAGFETISAHHERKKGWLCLTAQKPTADAQP
jgi:ubiquinone/menaquinone biosynthesis C-methylase UbiE